VFWYASAPIPDKIPDKFSGSSQKHRRGASTSVAISVVTSQTQKKPILKKGTTTNGLTTEDSGFLGYLLRKNLCKSIAS
jgi:hypothetical protein